MTSKIVREKRTIMNKLYKKVRNTYWASYRFVSGFISSIWYRFFGHKHHIIKTGLTPCCWYEVDAKLLYGNMELLKWFVENDMRPISESEYKEEMKRIEAEEGEEYKDGYLAQWADQYEKQKQILDIYTWWLNYENRLEDIDEALDIKIAYARPFYSDSDSVFHSLHASQNMNEKEKSEYDRLARVRWDKEEKLEAEEKEMLHKIVDLKDSLWS